MPTCDVKAARKLGWRQRQYGRSEIRFSVHVLLPIALCGGRVAWLAIRYHGVGIIQHRMSGSQPVAGSLAVERNQKTVARAHVNRQPRRGIRSRGIISKLRTIGIDE